MKLSHQTIELSPTHPFVIARGGYSHHRNVIVRLTDDDGLEGYGEAAPNRYYGESVSTVIAALGQFKPVLERADPFSLESIEAHLNRVLRGNASAKSAVSSALHDLVGKRLGLPVFRLWGLDAATTPQSSFTIAIAENHELERRVAEAREYPILKIKLGTDRDTEIVRIIRNAAPEKRLRVDANAAWTAKHAVRMSDFRAWRCWSSPSPRTTSRDSASSANGPSCRFSLTSRAWWRPMLPSSPEPSMASISSSQNVAASAKRCGWCTPRARWTCRSWPAA